MASPGLPRETEGCFALRDEGVIKFECRWTECQPAADPLLDQLIEYRRMLFQLNLIGVYPDGIGFGNISARVATGSAGFQPAPTFLISASQSGHLSEITAAHFSLVTKYSINQNWVECSGTFKASSESLTHAMIYEIFPDANAVIHVHSNSHWRQLQGSLPTSRASVPYGTPEMAQEVLRLRTESALASEKVFVMAGHEDGILSFGASLPEAFQVLKRSLFAR